jgi:uncharacterized membrane protein
MELSLFLAKLLGLYLLIMGVFMIARGEAISHVIAEMLSNRPTVFLSGLIALIIGLAMVIGHSVWELNWRGLITVIGYLSVAKGIVRVGFPDIPRRAADYVVHGTGRGIWIGFLLIAGGYLTWVGFIGG